MALSVSILNTPPTSVEERRQAALAIAAQCIQALKQDFGATEALVFGSLRGDTPWHSQSDLDLAVEGISSDAILDVYKRLEVIVPGWLPFDVVLLEQADERVRDRILQLTPMPENIYLALKVRIEDELARIEQAIDRLEALTAQLDTLPDIAWIPALAAYLEDFYSGCEKLARRIAVMLEGNLPKGENWHEQLLQQMGKSGGDGRPPLWNPSLLQELDEYRRFRHLTRHRYRSDLEGPKLLRLAQRVPMVFIQIQQSVATFGEWLDQKALAIEP